MNENQTTQRTKAALLAENAKMRAALERCASSFVLKPPGQDEIDWEGLALEFWCRMYIAGEALQS